MSRVAITGASGLLGGNLAAELVAAGHVVVATRRAGTKADHLDDLPITWREADLDSAPALAAAFAGCEAVFHCAAKVTVKREVTPDMVAANVTGTENVLAACRAAGVRRVIHTSSVVTIGLSDDGKPVDETAAWNYEAAGLVDAYATTKRQAEAVALAATDLDVVVVNPTYMFGPRDARPSSGKLILDIARRRVPGSTSGFNNFVDARDVARGMIAAWLRGRRGERYILGGEEMTYRGLFTMIAEVTGVRPPRLQLPFAIARVVGAWGDLRERMGGDPVVNSTQVRYAYSQRLRVSSDKAARELGYASGELVAAITDAVVWFRARGML